MRAHHVHELVADAHHGVERVHRALEDHGDVAPAEAAQLLLALADEVLAAEEDAAADDAAGRAEDLHDRVRDGRLAAAGLAGEPEDLPGRIVEVDAVDGAVRLAVAVLDHEPAELEQRPRARRRGRGSRARLGVFTSGASSRAGSDERLQRLALPLLGPQPRIADLVDPGEQEHEPERR